MRIAIAFLLAVSALCAAADARVAPVRLGAPRKLQQVSGSVNTPQWAAAQAALLQERGRSAADGARAQAPAGFKEPYPGNSGWSALYPNIPGNTNRAWRASTILWPGRAAPAVAAGAPAAGGRLEGGARQGVSAASSAEEYPYAARGPNGNLFWH